MSVADLDPPSVLLTTFAHASTAAMASASSPSPSQMKKTAAQVAKTAEATGCEFSTTIEGITTTGVDAMGLLDHLEKEKKAQKNKLRRKSRSATLARSSRG